MEFNLGKENDCTDFKLESLSRDEDVEFEYVQFRRSSVADIADIMKNGVTGRNQNLVIDGISCKKAEFEKLGKKRYKVTFLAGMESKQGLIMMVKAVLGNVSIDIAPRDIRYDGEDVVIDFAKMTVYPSRHNFYEVIED